MQGGATLPAPMQGVKASAAPRAGLLGNPSDLYGGRGIGFAFREFSAQVDLDAAARISLDLDLLQAAWQVLRAHAAFPERPFTARWSSDIPRQAGLSGSSALVLAFLRAATAWHDLRLAPMELARLAWRAENEILGIRAGPMDRLVQAFGGLVAMDFAEPMSVERLAPALLPPLFIAWDAAPGQSSGAVHAPVYERWQQGDPAVRAVIAEYRPLVARGLDALRARDLPTLCACVNRNFDLRAQLFPIAPRDRQMIDLGRARGAATKFCGSGGAVLVVTTQVADLRKTYEAAGFPTLIPTLSAPCT